MEQGFKIVDYIQAQDPQGVTGNATQTTAAAKPKPVEKPKDGMIQALMTKGYRSI